MDAAEAGREIDHAVRRPAGGAEARRRRRSRCCARRASLSCWSGPVVQTAIVGGRSARSSPSRPIFCAPSLRCRCSAAAPSSRLWLAVREKLGAAYGISAAVQTVDLDTRLLAIRTAVANDKAAGVDRRQSARNMPASSPTASPSRARSAEARAMSPATAIGCGRAPGAGCGPAAARAARLPRRLPCDLRAASAGLRSRGGRGRHARAHFPAAVDRGGGGAVGRRPAAPIA